MMNEHYELTFMSKEGEEVLRTSDSFDSLYDYLEDLLSADEDDGKIIIDDMEFSVEEGRIRRLVKLDDGSCYTIWASYNF